MKQNGELYMAIIGALIKMMIHSCGHAFASLPGSTVCEIAQGGKRKLQAATGIHCHHK